jgi:hypothetical protein
VKLADFVVIDDTGARAAERSPNSLSHDAEARAGVFTSPQSLVAFPVAVSIVVTISRASRTIGRTDFDSIAVPLTAALAVGAGIGAITLSDRRARPRTLGGWILALATALTNSLVLFAAALGIDKF